MAANASSPRILLVRLSAIGDSIHAMPVLCALRDRFPAAFLAWVVEERAAALLKGHAALDEQIAVPRGWLKSPRTVWNLRQRLHALRFDVVVDVQGLTRSAIVAGLSGAKRRIGFGDDKGRELSRLFYTERVRTTAQHIIDCNLQLLRPLGIESPKVRFGVPEHEADRQTAEATLQDSGLQEGFAILNPGAGSISRLWPPDRFAAVARHLGEAWRRPSLVVWAGPKEREFAETIAASSGGHARVAPPTSLTQLAALVRRAGLFVSSDTGPLHLAAAVGTPCIGLFGPCPGARNGPYGPLHATLEASDFQAPTRSTRKARRKILVESIPLSVVCDACDRILRAEGARAA